MSKRFEGFTHGFDQTDLFFQTWAPERARGVFLITHGLAEHSECYHRLAEALTPQGWQVYAWDMRGHGRSEGKRGYVRHVDDFVADLGAVHTLVRERHPGLNVVLFGHSLGGLVTLRYAESAPAKYAALALSSPALGLTTAVPKVKEALAHVAARWLPTLTMSNEIRYEDLSRDEAMRKAYAADNLRHEKISPGLYLSMVESFATALSDVERVNAPVLMQISGDDRIVSAAASRELFAKFKTPSRNQMHVYPDSLHEIFNDLDRERVIADLKAFINPYLGD